LLGFENELCSFCGSFFTEKKEVFTEFHREKEKRNQLLKGKILFEGNTCLPLWRGIKGEDLMKVKAIP